MDASEAVNLGRQAVMLLLVVAAPVLLVGFIVALVVSLIQALTQMQEQTLSFVPKILAMLLALAAVGPWMLSRMVEFSQKMFTLLP
jgi:flagellar biosynthetic protein FliQ